MAMTPPRETSWLERRFHVSERGSTVVTEIRAGITTFLTMAYIIFVNPAILSVAIDFDESVGQLVTVTCLAAAFGTLLMGLWANLPFALAPGMGLNAFFTFTAVGAMGLPWQTALGAVFVSGILFIVVAVTGLRQWILGAIPLYLKHAISAGIGAFLAIIGFSWAGLIQASEDTLVTRGDWTAPGPWLAMLGLVIAVALLALRVRGALMIAILGVTMAAIVFGADVYGGRSFSEVYQGVIGFSAPSDLVGALDIGAALGIGILTVVFTFLFVDFFDSAGTLIGLADKAGMMDGQGNIEAPRAAFTSDAAATTVGAVLGTSSTTTYIESAAGLEDGARTGLSSVVVAALFLVAMLFAPLAGIVPQVATAPVLIVVGAMMMTAVKSIDWSAYRQSIPAFLAIVGMPFTFSITDGISLGIIAHTVIMAVTGKARDVHWVMYVLTFLLIWRYFVVG